MSQWDGVERHGVPGQGGCPLVRVHYDLFDVVGAQYEAFHRLGPGRPVGRSFLYGYGHDGHESHPGSPGPRLVDAPPDGGKHIASLSKVLVLVSAFGVLVIVGGVIAINGAKILDMGIFIILMVLLHNLGGFLIGYFVTGKLGLGKKQQHSVTLEVGMQNDALAISLVSVFFAPAVAIPAAVGAAIHQVTGSILAGIFARHMEAHEAKERAAEAKPLIEAVPGNH